MFTSWKSRVGALALTATTSLVGVASSAGAAKSDPKDACKGNGWKALVRVDGTSFKNQGACVSYAAQGATPTVPRPDLVPEATCVFETSGYLCNAFVKNVGSGPAIGRIGASSLFNGNGGSGSYDISLAPGASAALGGVGVVDASSAVHVEINVDTGNVIAESNETNNALDETIVNPNT